MRGTAYNHNSKALLRAWSPGAAAMAVRGGPGFNFWSFSHVCILRRPSWSYRLRT